MYDLDHDLALYIDSIVKSSYCFTTFVFDLDYDLNLDKNVNSNYGMIVTS
jgi:hypothetical protein